MKKIFVFHVLFIATMALLYVSCSKKKDTAENNTSTTIIPVATFTANPTSVTPGDSVTFTDQTTNSPASWSWTFSGGTPSTSSQQNPVIKYNTAGIYNVILTATNSAGNNTITKTNYITVTSESPGTLTADFTANNTTVVCFQDVTFTDISTGNPTSWAWTFTNGTPSTSNLQNPVVRWQQQGAFTVKLIVTNSIGGTNTLIRDYYISAAANLLFWKNFSGPNIKVYVCIIPGVPYDALNPTVNLRGSITSYSTSAPNCGAVSGWVSVIASGFMNYYCLEETTGRHWSLNNYNVPQGTCAKIGLTNSNVDP